MELDDLKQAWQQQTPEDIDVRNDKNIIDMIQNKSYGPLASLKDKYIRQFCITILSYVVVVFYYFSNPEKWQKVLHDKILIAFILLTIPIAWVIRIIQVRSYILINKLQTTDNPIKSDIESKIAYIERGLKIQRLFGIGMGCAFLAFVEIIMYLHPEKDWGSFKNISIYIRILMYIGYMALVYFLSGYTYYRQFGKHIDYMKDMLRKME